MPTVSQLFRLLVGFCLITAGIVLPGAGSSLNAVVAPVGLRIANAQQEQTPKKPKAKTEANPKRMPTKLTMRRTSQSMKTWHRRRYSWMYPHRRR
jgi:hypothetical protein